MIRKLYIHAKTKEVCIAKGVCDAQQKMGVSFKNGYYFISMYDPFQDKDAKIPPEIQPLADELRAHMLKHNIF